MLKIDFHTHSIASGHAINTIYEMIHIAKNKGITHLGITEHGPAMEGAPHSGYFWISDQLTKLQGIDIFLGIESNIINQDGEIDLDKDLLSKQRIVSAGLHKKTPYDNCVNANHTESIINAISNPLVKIITHPYRPEFPTDLEQIFYESYKNDTLLELNNNLFSYTNHLPELIFNYTKLIKLCKKYNYPIIVGSDAHIAEKIGDDTNIKLVQEKLDLPEELIINNHYDTILRYTNSIEV
ncbi:putative phosphatase [Bacteroidia bacterium]|nr:putative phosphatase [Bacteroidia bacterium]